MYETYISKIRMIVFGENHSDGLPHPAHLLTNWWADHEEIEKHLTRCINAPNEEDQ